MKESDTSVIRRCPNKAQPLYRRPHYCVLRNVLTLAVAILVPRHAHASLFEGEQLDSVANAMSWVVLVIVPLVAITVFWIIHILPEKIAEKRHHPQAKAIQCLCLLSLAFGGLLWPLAWLWAYSKPVLHKMAYGTDVGESHEHTEVDTAAPKDEPKHAGELPEERADLQAHVSRVEAPPEPIAEKRQPPQTMAVQLVSLALGVLLWPLAWLGAFAKSMLNKTNRGTDLGGVRESSAADAATQGERAREFEALSDEVARLRAGVAELKARLSDKGVDL